MRSLIEYYKELPEDCVIYKLTIAGQCYVGSTKGLGERIKDHLYGLRGGNHHSRYMQNSYNKHGKENLYLEILFKFDSIPDKMVLLQKEKDYIDLLQPKFNSELDPTTKNNCVTTSRRVCQYSMDGDFIEEFSSCKEAQRILKITGVSHAANPKMIAMSAGGFRFSYDKTDKLPKYTNNSRLAKVKKIESNDNQGNSKVYGSIAEAARDLFPNTTNFDSVCACISSAALGKTKAYKGYNFKVI